MSKPTATLPIDAGANAVTMSDITLPCAQEACESQQVCEYAAGCNGRPRARSLDHEWIRGVALGLELDDVVSQVDITERVRCVDRFEPDARIVCAA